MADTDTLGIQLIVTTSRETGYWGDAVKEGVHGGE